MNTQLNHSVGPTTIHFETSKRVTPEMLTEINRLLAEIEVVLDGGDRANILQEVAAYSG